MIGSSTVNSFEALAAALFIALLLGAGIFLYLKILF